MTIKYIGNTKATLRNGQNHPLGTLLWGDPVHILEESGGTARVMARGREGWLDSSDLSENSLLEIYVVDVGQGDSVLFKTPDEKWHLIDGGMANRDQMTKKGVANFLRWKFQEDLRQPTIALANVLLTHPDYDHYGGLLDVLQGKLFDGRTFEVTVENYYHNGLGRYSSSPKLGATAPGQVDPFPNGDRGIPLTGTFITSLFDDKTSFTSPPRKLSGDFGELARLISQVPQAARRLSQQDKFLPGYAPGNNEVSITVLGPILENLKDGRQGLRLLGNDSKTVNGHSLVLRLDYGKARILLTGDLNAKSQQLLLSYHPASEFAADVCKACHHGAEDVDLDFLRAMAARATVISSGDNENYSHPRPLLIGASGRYGREAVGGDNQSFPPLVYSTELARSVKLSYASSVQVKVDDETGSTTKTVLPSKTSVLTGDSVKYRPIKYTPLATDLVYGLVNVRTDGQRILCATMEEKGNDFDIKIFKAGVNAG